MLRTKLKLSMLVGVMGALPVCAQSQIAVKTNLLYDAALTPNLGVEATVGKHSSLQLTYALHPWQSDGRMTRHWVVNPSYRYWFCQPFMGHFFSIDAYGGQYRVQGVKLPLPVVPSEKDVRHAGWMAGGGLSYGYVWPLSKHLNFELSVGVGYIYAKDKAYVCGACNKLLEEKPHHYVGPTKAALSLVYVF